MCIVSMAFMSASQKLVFAVALLAYIDHVRSLTSANGCTCTSDCAPSFDDSRPWCYTANSCGSYAYSRASYYDYCTPPSPPPPSQVDGNRYHRCYLTSDCGGQCNSWAQCTYNPYGASCTASPFAYACDLQTTTCSSDKTGYFGYCPPGTVFDTSRICTDPTKPYGCVPALLPPTPPGTCPAFSTATSCYRGITGPSAVVASYQSRTSQSNDPDLIADYRSPPVPVNVGVNVPGVPFICYSYDLPCSSDAFSYEYTASECPAGQFVTRYGFQVLPACAQTVASFVPDIQAGRVQNVVVCGTSNCRVPPVGVPSGAGAGRPPAAPPPPQQQSLTLPPPPPPKTSPPPPTTAYVPTSLSPPPPPSRSPPPPLGGASTTSARGCICAGVCGPSVDDSSPWCYTANNCGSYSLSRFSYWDYCSPPPPPPAPPSGGAGTASPSPLTQQQIDALAAAAARRRPPPFPPFLPIIITFPPPPPKLTRPVAIIASVVTVAAVSAISSGICYCCRRRRAAASAAAQEQAPLHQQQQLQEAYVVSIIPNAAPPARPDGFSSMFVGGGPAGAGAPPPYGMYYSPPAAAPPAMAPLALGAMRLASLAT